MIPAVCDYVRAGSIDEALEALATPDAKLLSGGQSLLPAMKLRIARPSLLVDVGGLDLGGLEECSGELVMGALATWNELERAELLRRPAYRAIAECAAGIGDLQVRTSARSAAASPTPTPPPICPPSCSS
jgi:carbon-monoxide dehydrogenase medium subunit